MTFKTLFAALTHAPSMAKHRDAVSRLRDVWIGCWMMRVSIERWREKVRVRVRVRVYVTSLFSQSEARTNLIEHPSFHGIFWQYERSEAKNLGTKTPHHHGSKSKHSVASNPDIQTLSIRLVPYENSDMQSYAPKYCFTSRIPYSQ